MIARACLEALVVSVDSLDRQAGLRSQQLVDCLAHVQGPKSFSEKKSHLEVTRPCWQGTQQSPQVC